MKKVLGSIKRIMALCLMVPATALSLGAAAETGVYPANTSIAILHDSLRWNTWDALFLRRKRIPFVSSLLE